VTTLAQMSKAVRPYDPEDKRQRNSAFLPGLAAGGAVAAGAQTARQFQPASVREVASRLRRFEAPLKVRQDVRFPRRAETEISVGTRAKAIKTHGASVRSGPARTPIPKTYYFAPLDPAEMKQLRQSRRAAATKWGAATLGLSGLAALGYSRAANRKNRRWT
jgi:hypothetical protein